MDLIHPASRAEVAAALRDASADGRRVQLVGGRTHMDRAAIREADAELWTTQLDRAIAYDPAEMIAVVEAGMRVGELQRVLGRGRPGVAGRRAGRGDRRRRDRGRRVEPAAAARRSRPRHGRGARAGDRRRAGRAQRRAHREERDRVRHPPARDRLARLAGRHRAGRAEGAPAPAVAPHARARRRRAGWSWDASSCRPCRRRPRSSPRRTGVELRLEGWARRGRGADRSPPARSTDDLVVLEDERFPARPVDDAPVVVEAAVPPSRVAGARRRARGLDRPGRRGPRLGAGSRRTTTTVAARRSATGRAPRAASARVVRGVDRAHGVATAPLPAPEVHRRLKEAFDPGGDPRAAARPGAPIRLRTARS